MDVLNITIQNGYQITKYTKDGVTVSHTVKVPIQTEPIEPVEVEPQPSIEERILAENQYQTMLLELTTPGGM